MIIFKIGGETMSFAQMFAVMLTGMVVVFFGIIILIIFITLLGKAIPSIEKALTQKANKNTNTTAPAKPVASTPKPAVAKVEPVQATTTDDDDELIAVISSAVAMMSLADGKNYRVKSVKAIKGNTSGRPAWSMAGIRENTRQFQPFRR